MEALRTASAYTLFMKTRQEAKKTMSQANASVMAEGDWSFSCPAYKWVRLWDNTELRTDVDDATERLG